VFSLGLLTFLQVTRWLPAFQPEREKQNMFYEKNEKGSRR
jgi:hypothetical protein